MTVSSVPAILMTPSVRSEAEFDAFHPSPSRYLPLLLHKGAGGNANATNADADVLEKILDVGAVR
jgi:hypothetical protein